MSNGSSSSSDSNARPQLLPPIPGKLCAFGMRPLLLTGYLVDHLEQHFSLGATIEEPDLRSLIWRKTDDTGILISTESDWRPTTTGKRPAIIVKRNSYQNVKKGINNFVGTTKQGFDEFASFWVGSHTLFCLQGTGASADLLATEVQREFTQFGPIIRKYLDLHAFVVHEVGPRSELEEAHEHSAVPVTIGWAYEESWQVFQHSMPIRKILASFLLNC